MSLFIPYKKGKGKKHVLFSLLAVFWGSGIWQPRNLFTLFLLKIIVMCNIRYNDFCIQHSICRLSEQVVYIPEDVTYCSCIKSLENSTVVTNREVSKRNVTFVSVFTHCNLFYIRNLTLLIF